MFIKDDHSMVLCCLTKYTKTYEYLELLSYRWYIE